MPEARKCLSEVLEFNLLTTLTRNYRFKYNVFCIAFLLYVSLTLEVVSGIYLAHKCVGRHTKRNEKLPVIMLHGLTDLKETWDGIYQSVNYLTGRRVCIYDARNHGDSGWSDRFNVDVLVEDLEDFMRNMKIERASLVGHSMGGFTIMKFSFIKPKKVESLFVEDIAPNSASKGQSEVYIKQFRMMLDSLSAVPKEADEETAKEAILDYITKVEGKRPPSYFFEDFPLRCKKGVWQWKVNFKALIKTLEKDGYFVGKMEGEYDGRAFFIYGTESQFKVNEHEDDIRKFFPKAEFFGVQGADHDVHLNTTIFINKLVHFLNDVTKNSG